ncbi:hypothetical protein Hanom_Chr09g00763571 [Helianthus anomalus]
MTMYDRKNKNISQTMYDRLSIINDRYTHPYIRLWVSVYPTIPHGLRTEECCLQSTNNMQHTLFNVSYVVQNPPILH